jgi:hypothetical protein
MPHAIHDIGVASQIGAYSDAVEARPNLRWLLTSGTPGLSTTGDLPKDISGQAELAWCDPTAHRLVRRVVLPPPHHPRECLWEPPEAAGLGVG